MSERVVILGIYVTDLAFRASRMPVIGETIAGSAFAMGPGGKGSNQAVAAARAGADVVFCTRLGNDAFGEIARATWAAEGITARAPAIDGMATGAAHIFVDETTGMNAIIVAPGAAGTMAAADAEAIEADIAASRVFVTQLEQPLDAARRGLEIARRHGVTTVFNPAPAMALPDDIYALCDYVTPNETEAAALTGIAVRNADDARRAADVLLAKGAGAVIVTLGEAGALLHTREASVLLPAYQCGPVVETAGAGDGFTGGFAAALARGDDALAATRFGCALAGISVTRPGTAPSMPTRAEVDAMLARTPAAAH
ncbi:ribokinase [Paraburkholderia tropica]|uniref:Ribokinase n=2 Tax=Paraburkholderia TaxID=1822464 RepID=A0A1A5X2I3_9BURK|nr:ribokinase [Paraburkholderia tropica]MBB2981657.1 ribokinase [Paraburkholderia tropica]MBB3005151.1 ribokinase [Paraburkholderia tropica]MBB6320683.1 ribokinase [Paraburkholderia tropica]MDE1138453.1 ribokinase [Paraburkholderia tropica]OBR47539.1 ribokinase [Paraburkholderia tropica]